MAKKVQPLKENDEVVEQDNLDQEAEETSEPTPKNNKAKTLRKFDKFKNTGEIKND